MVYSYTYDEETGGLLLNSSPTGFSKEPRPVYAPELDALGFDQYWRYDNQTDLPYLWAESNYYYYRGKLVAKLRGGNVYTAPEIIIPDGEDNMPVQPEPQGIALRPVNIEAMVEANRGMMEIIEGTTVKKIVAIYTKYKEQLDCFHVAFSGGKDSCVLLDLVKKALPKGSYVVIFGDTGMEFPDTYTLVDEVAISCAEEGISFFTAASHMTPEESWSSFGPPSRTLRWCCSVHKSTPQTMKLREITGKRDYTGLAFVGVRAHESVARSQYEYFNDGKKIKGQYDFYPILEWTSAEIWLYIFTNNLTLNEAYKIGHSRVGCLLCPMSAGTSDFMRYNSYQSEVDSYLNLIRTYSDKEFTDSKFKDFIKKSGWVSRADGRYIPEVQSNYREEHKDGKLIITIKHPSSDWKEWEKTHNATLNYNVLQSKDGYIVEMDEDEVKHKQSEAKFIRQVFKKSTFCNACGVCGANCKNGCISFSNGRIKIRDCTNCKACHQLPGGCLRYDSLKIPNGGTKMRAINSFNDHAPKKEWISDFFRLREDFFSEHTLGPDQSVKFKAFLADSGLTYKRQFSPFANLLSRLDWESESSQGLLLINLVSNNPQVEWYVKNLVLGQSYTQQDTVDALLSQDVKDRPAKQITRAFKRLTETPLGTNLRFGYVTEEGNLVRTKCNIGDSRVVLYGLFQFAEKCNNYNEFLLSTLMNDSIDRDGISPTRIFGLDREEMIPILLGLSAKYSDFISASFTHDLEKISLAENKSSKDVLKLFEEEKDYG